MKSEVFLKSALCLVVATALSGCLGSGGSGGGGGGAGGGGGGGSAGFEAAHDAANAKVPTSDMPTRIAADYSGQFKAGVNSGSANGVNENVEIIGDVAVAVDWTNGQTTNPFSGTASNIVVTDVQTGDSETLTGTLNVDGGIGGVIERTTIPAQNVGGFSIPEVNTGSFQFGMTGDLSGSEGDLEATVLLGGNFRGPGGESMVGVVSGGIREVGSTNPALFDAGIGGVIYLNRQ